MYVPHTPACLSPHKSAYPGHVTFTVHRVPGSRTLARDAVHVVAQNTIEMSSSYRASCTCPRPLDRMSTAQRYPLPYTAHWRSLQKQVLVLGSAQSWFGGSPTVSSRSVLMSAFQFHFQGYEVDRREASIVSTESRARREGMPCLPAVPGSGKMPLCLERTWETLWAGGKLGHKFQAFLWFTL